ncbi:hypothetical protein ACLQ2R_12175 [Streptosporangium sp. DT93]|uniref:hypothetical protein n=1 Tax=Streptosporangium sp. DT93 TaxID=3393428 RepID=UPI003CF040BD
MRRRFLLAVTGWLVTGLLAIGAGVAVIDRLGEPLTDTGLRPLSAAEVDEALVLASSRPGASPAPALTPGAPSRATPGVPSASAAPGPEVTPAPTVTVTVTQAPSASAGPTGPAASAGKSGVIDTAGGRVIARCQNALVTLRSWSPAQGFQADDVERGPASRAYVEFESEEREVKVEVYCAADGSPAHRVRA